MTIKNTWLWMLHNPLKTIVFTAILTRLIIISCYGHVTLYSDSEDYISLARLLAQFDLKGYEGERTPGFPLLISLSMMKMEVTAAFQLLIGLATLCVSYKTFDIIFPSKQIALGLSLFSAIYIPTVFFELAILSESLTLFVITLTVFLFLQISMKGKSSFTYLALTSMACGYLVLIKPFYIFLPFVLIVFLFFRKVNSPKTHLKHLMILALPLVIFTGWSYLNKQNTGYFVSTTFYGFNIAQNCVSFAENTTDEYKLIGNTYAKYRDENIKKNGEIAMSIWDAYPELKEKTKLSFADLSHTLYNYSIATIEMNPWKYIKQVGISWGDFWKTSLYCEFDKFRLPQSLAIVRAISLFERVILQLLKILFVLLVPYNLYLLGRKRELSYSSLISIVVFTASLLQAVATYGTNSRFSYPFEMLIAASVILNIYEMLAARNKKSCP